MTDWRRRAVAQRILRAYLAGNDASPAVAVDVLSITEEALNRLSDAPFGVPQPPRADPDRNPFPGWLTRERLTIREATRALGASSTGVQSWKRERPPRYVLLACAALSAGCQALKSSGADDNPFPGWMEGSGLTMRQSAKLLGVSTSSIAGYKRTRPRLYVLLACAAWSKGLAPIA